MDMRQVICGRCKKSVPILDIKYLQKGDGSNIALCSSCRKVDAQQAKDASVKKKSVQKELYLCSRCNYKFRFDLHGVTNLKCPYCGKPDKVAKFQEQSADDLVKTAEDAEGFYSKF